MTPVFTFFHWRSTRNMNVMAFRPRNMTTTPLINFINFNHFHRFHDLNIFPRVHPNPSEHRFEQKVAHGRTPQVVSASNLDVGVLHFCHVDHPTIWKGVHWRKRNVGDTTWNKQAAGWNMVSLKQPLCCKVLCSRKSSKGLSFRLVLSDMYFRESFALVEINVVYSIVSYHHII